MRRALPLLLAIAAFLTIAVVWIVTDRRAAKHAYDVYSAANTADDGTSYAFAYLRGQQRKVAMLTKPLATAGIERNAVVFRITEEAISAFDAAKAEMKDDKKKKPVRELLSDDEQAFVRGGGRLVLAAQEGLLGTAKTSDSVAWRVFPLWPGVDSFLPPVRRGFTEGQPQLHSIFNSGGRTVIGRRRLGAGEVFLVATPEIFQNSYLRDGNRLAVVSALAGTNRPVYFDEIVHGLAAGDGPIVLLKEWGFGPFLLLLLAMIGLLLWRYGTRIGPPEDDYRDARSDAVDLVRSLAALYQRSTSRADALKLYHDALVRTVAAHTGLRGDALHKRVAALADGYQAPVEEPSAPEFRTRLEIINDAFRQLGTGGKHANHR